MKKIIVSVIFFLYCSFIVLDFNGNYIISNYVKFSIITLVFTYGAINQNPYVIMGLFLTVFCDYILLFTDSFSIGILMFSAVHLIYINMQLKKGKPWAFLSLSLPFLFLPFGIITQSAFYAFLILSNLFISIKEKNSHLAIGFMFFILCDICVAGYALIDSQIMLMLIWIFYVPSQLIISSERIRAKLSP